MDTTYRILKLVSALATSTDRQSAARLLARETGGEDLIIWVRDEALGRALPAPGFSQAIPGGRDWRQFIDARGLNPREGTLPWLGEPTGALGFGDENGNVLVILGGTPDKEAGRIIATLLPVLSIGFASERIEQVAEGNAALAEQSARKASLLADSLEHARNALRLALAEAQAANRAKDYFLATLSHELRTPLTPIMLTVADLESDLTLPPGIREDMSMIRRNVELEARLIDDLLDLSRVVTGKLHLRAEPMDLSAAVNDAVENCESFFKERGVSLIREPSAPLPLISADPTRVRQVLWNLLRNAAKFTPVNGTVRIRTESLPAKVRATVCDTGIGIAPDKLRRIFETFEQVNSETMAQAGGLGLGLAISKAIVEMHGGSISAQSDGLGQGSTFTVELPAGAG